MKIAICDDEKPIVQLLERMVESVLLRRGREYEIQSFFLANELLKKIEELDIVFLDIDMPGIDGIDAGKIICSTNQNCKIIMASSRTERFKESFYINAFRFITKPFEISEIEEALDAYFNQLIGQDMLEVFSERVAYNVMQKEISFAVAYNGYVEIMVKGCRFRKECSLNSLDEILDDRCFYRINKQYCVNLFKIDQYSKGAISIGDVQAKVSRRKQKEFEKKYNEFNLLYR